MKHLIIIGAGGLGRQMYAWAKECKEYLVDFDLKGFLDDNPHALDCFDGYPPVLSGIASYEVKPDDAFLLAMGDNENRIKCISAIKDKGGVFPTIIHPGAFVYTDKIGEGCFITPLASIGVDAVIGDHCLIQGGALIGHDVKIGNNVRIDCNVVCVGGIQIGNNVCIHTGAIINHGVTVEDESMVGAMSFVIRKVKRGTTVYGNPAIKVEY